MLDIAKLHLKRADSNYRKIVDFDLSEKTFDSQDKVDTLDAFIFRFSKLQDFLSDKLFREILKALGEYNSPSPFIDILDKLEKLGMIKSSDRWVKYRSIRNKITHEYPDEHEELIASIKTAIKYFKEIKEDMDNIENYLLKKGLIESSTYK